MNAVGSIVMVGAILIVAGSSGAHAQQLGLGNQMLPQAYIVPSPTFPGGGTPAYSQPTFESVPSYQPSTPRYLPSYGGGMAGSTFNPR